jgi:hypothetical protein
MEEVNGNASVKFTVKELLNAQDLKLDDILGKLDGLDNRLSSLEEYRKFIKIGFIVGAFLIASVLIPLFASGRI